MDKNSVAQLINQLYEIENKLQELGMLQNFERNLNRIKTIWEDSGYRVQNPTNEMYSEARTDCEANIVGNVGTKMMITKTIKPVIYYNEKDSIQLVQKAIVFVEQK